MIKKHWEAGCHVLLIALSAILLLAIYAKSGHPVPAPLTKYAFQGEYSRDRDTWLPLDEDAELSALDGDLFLRGRFDRDIPEGMPVSFYLDHIAYCIYVNGELITRSGNWDGASPSACAQCWGTLLSPGIGPEDVVEINLRNHHRFGNLNAYSGFLESLYPCSQAELKMALEQETFFSSRIGFLVLILSFGIIGTALAFSVMKMPVSRQLWPLGLMSLFAGGYILLDNVDTSLWSHVLAFNTYMQLVCAMLAVLELGGFLMACLSSKARKAAQIIVGVEGVLLAVVAVLCLMDRILIYDALPYWTAAQFLCCPTLLACCVYEWRKEKRRWPPVLPACILLLAAIVLELVNGLFMWWPKGVMAKTVFVVLLILMLAISIKNIPVYYQKSIQADKLASDLKNSYIILAMSQIKTHFIFNVLNAISGLCKYDPERADRTVICFARYLRSNIDIMKDQPSIEFRTELRHLEDYIALEQVRFGDRIRFAKDIGADDFYLPPMILLPIAENSVKHGLRPKPGGGTVFLRTWTEGDAVKIMIQDDGAGFDPDTLDQDGAQFIGLSNVRFRLHHLMNGTLDIESSPGEGTAVTISIPCEEAKNARNLC